MMAQDSQRRVDEIISSSSKIAPASRVGHLDATRKPNLGEEEKRIPDSRTGLD